MTNSIQNISLTCILLLAATLMSPAVLAKDPIYTGFFSNKAVDGYDVVAYFTQGEPRKGKDEFATEYKGARWLFASQAHLDAFAADPDAYAPQYGGYCAWAVSQGDTASAEPHLWTIVDGKLYLNYNQDIQHRWEQDIPGFIEKADRNWPAVIE